MKKLASSLKELNLPGSKKYIHTIGVTNVGKSSLLNTLRATTKHCNLKLMKSTQSTTETHLT
jgi:ribosome biogenesis GTPase A